MEKENLNTDDNKFKDSLDEVINLLKKNHNLQAEKKAIELLITFPNSHILNDLMGSICVRLNKLNEAVSYFEESIKISPNFVGANHNMGVVLQKLEKYDQALKCFERTTDIKKDFYVAYNNAGITLNQQKKYKKAIVKFNQAIKYNPNYAEAYFNLGLTYQRLDNHHESIRNYKNAIKLNRNYKDAFFNLGEVCRKLNKFNEALHYYKESKNERSNPRILECLFSLQLSNDYINSINYLSKKDPVNRRIAAISSYAAAQLNVFNVYPFCPNPIDFIHVKNLNHGLKERGIFLEELLKEIISQDFAWEPYSRTTVKGLVTKGNLSDLKLPKLSLFQNIMCDEIIEYNYKFKDKKCLFISNWPKEFKFMMWSNRLTSDGYNIPHIHPSGWLSGVFYLKIPKLLKDDEAGIEFSLHGDNYKIINSNIPKKTYSPSAGDLVLFPSSLYHKTIPFKSNEERVCIAFDIIPL